MHNADYRGMRLKVICTKNVFRTVSCWVLCLLVSGFADEIKQDSTIKELPKVVVTATKQSRSITDIPVSATIISKEEIALSEAKNIDDLLQHVVGVQVKRAVGMGEGVPSDIIMRGIPGALAATRTLILVDGIPTNVSGTPFLILNEIPLEAVKQIEIIRGPFSSIYGANAFGGVINIITDIGDGRPYVSATAETSYPFTSIDNYGKKNRETNLDFWGENARLAYWNFSGVTGAGDDKADILVAGGYRTIGNYILQDSALAKKGNTTRHKDISNHDYTDFRVFMKSGLRISSTMRNTVHLRYFNSDLGFGKTETKPDANVNVRGSKLLVGDFIDFTPTEKLHLKTGGFFRVVQGIYDDKADSLAMLGDSVVKYQKVPTIWFAESRDVQGEGSVIFTPSPVHTIITGFDVLYNSIYFGALKYRTSGDIRLGGANIDKSFWNAGVYVHDDIQLQMFNITPAIRGDYHSEFGWMISPKLGISSRLADRLTLRISAGTAFRAPSTTELYGNVVVGAVKVYGNPNLDPERVFSVDGGFEFDVVEGVTVVSSYFHNNMNRLIALSLDRTILDMAIKNKLLEVTHGNIDKAYSWGIENEIRIVRFKPVDVTVNYTFTQSNNEETGKTLDYIPTHKAAAEVGFARRFAKGTLHLSLKEGFVGFRNYLDWSVQPTPKFWPDKIRYVYNYVTLKPYWRTDCSFSYVFGNKQSVSLTAQNLFDATIEESAGTYSPGRFLSLKYSVPFTF